MAKQLVYFIFALAFIDAQSVTGRNLSALGAPTNLQVTRNRVGSGASATFNVDPARSSACPSGLSYIAKAVPIWPWSWSNLLSECTGDRTVIKVRSATLPVKVTGLHPSIQYTWSAWTEDECNGASAAVTRKEQVVIDGYLSTPGPNSSFKMVNVSANAPSTFVWLTPEQKRRMKSLTSIFENSNINQDYSYAENLGDGRGITFGIIGFCTGSGDGLDVLLQYQKLKPENALNKYIPRLTALNDTRSPANPLNDDVSGLEGFSSAVSSAAYSDPLFRKAQDLVSDKLVYKPSQRTAAYYKLKYALSKAQIYDAWVNHGYGDVEYYDSANALIDWTNERLGGSPRTGVDEKLWIRTFLQRRWYVLAKKDRVWAESVARIKIYQYLANANAWELNTSIKIQGGCCGRSGVCGTNRIAGQYYGSFSIP